ncbi:Rap1a/Tai family immunity protein [Roseibium album]|uniref:Rap1a/Tai family immunity protein n=1 Tax=Roseibium album TaxID=311410 RepID=UPI000D55D3D0
MRFGRILIAITFFMGAAQVGQAQSISAGVLMESCKGERNEFSEGYCHGIIAGAITGAGIGAAIAVDRFNNGKLTTDQINEAATDIIRYCPPDIKAEELVAVIVSYIEARPEQWDERGLGIIYAAFRAKFPCQ